MAATKIHFALCRAMHGDMGKAAPVQHSAAVGSIAATPTGASQALNLVCAGNDLIWVVTSPVDVWVEFGAAPTAVEGTTWLVLAGQSREFAAKNGDKPAVILA